MHDLEKLAAALQERFPSPPPSSRGGWGNPAIDVLDAVMSLNRRYDRVVLPRIKLFKEARPEVGSLPALQTLMASYGTPGEFLKKELNTADPQRAETLRGVIEYLLDVQHEFPADTERDRLAEWARWARPGDYAFTGVRGFGLAGFQYLRLLLGADTAKPDVWIRRFVAEAVNREVSDVEALFLLERAAKRLGLKLRDVDSAIWTERARTAPS